MVSRGEVDFVVSGLPPLIGTPDIEWLGYLPEEINSWLLFSGGVGVNAREPEARPRAAQVPGEPGGAGGVQGEWPGTAVTSRGLPSYFSCRTLDM